MITHATRSGRIPRHPTLDQLDYANFDDYHVGTNSRRYPKRFATRRPAFDYLPLAMNMTSNCWCHARTEDHPR